MMSINIIFTGLALTVFLQILSVESGFIRPDKLMRENDTCSHAPTFPKSHCRTTKNCETLPVYLNTTAMTICDVPSCGFRDHMMELLCCPDELPNSNVTPLPVTVGDKLTFTHLASLGYLKPDTLDTIIYSCTAVVLTPTFLIATSKCLGDRAVEQNPKKVLLGVSDPRVFETLKSLEIEIQINVKVLNNDLVLLRLHKNIQVENPSVNVSIATICDAADLQEKSKLYAVGFAQTKGTNCALFKQQLNLVSSNNCSSVQNERQVQGINIPNTHLCVTPLQDMDSHPSQKEDCKKCLTASTSVLHVERSDGSLCVAGIATPTTAECFVNGNPLYYTSVLSDIASDFFNLNTENVVPVKRFGNRS